LGEDGGDGRRGENRYARVLETLEIYWSSGSQRNLNTEPAISRLSMRFLEAMDRERKALIAEMVLVKGLMPLLMKARNGGSWSEQDKGELVGHFRRLSRMSPYLAAVLLPGGFALLPLLTWWVDRRRLRRTPPSQT
jgi:hypothetical protein